jgi:hypothetical protein
MAMKLKKILLEFKPLFLQALETNTLEAYVEVLEKANFLKFEIYEHRLCKRNKFELIEQQAIIDNLQKIIEEVNFKFTIFIFIFKKAIGFNSHSIKRMGG